jgi:Ras-related protein Rab-7A
MKTSKKILLIGDAGSGKTQILNRYVKDEFSEDYEGTIGAYFKNKEIDNLQLKIWDISWQNNLESLSESFYRYSDAFLVCFDLSNEKSLENVSKWIQKFKEQTIYGDDFKNIYLVGTKSDLEQKISDEDIQNFIEEHNKQEGALQISQSFYKTSAKDNAGINEMFKDVANKLVTENVNINDPNHLQNQYGLNDSQIDIAKQKEDKYIVVESTKKTLSYAIFSAGSVGLFASVMLTILFAVNGQINHAACYGSLIASYITSVAAMIPTSFILGIGAIKNGVNINEHNKQVADEKKYNLLCKFTGIEVKNTKEKISYMNMFDPTIDVTKTSHYL